MAPASIGDSLDVELLLDRFLSSSTPTDCLDSLGQLTVQCRFRRPKQLVVSQQQQLDDEDKKMIQEKEEEERQFAAIDALLRNPSVLNSLCSLVATSTTQPTTTGMEVEGGDVAACELLLVLLTPPPNAASSAVGAGAGRGMTTGELQRQQRHKRRMEYISKTLLHFHDDDVANSTNPPGGNAQR